MLRFAANLSTMFTELPFLDRFAAARGAGFTAVEVQFPYEAPAMAIAERLDDNGLTMVLFNLSPGNIAAGEKGFGALPGREKDFDTALNQALGYAEVLGTKLLHCMAGVPGDDVDHDDALHTFVSNLKRAAEIATPKGVTLLVEPVNLRDNPGYFLSDIDMARHVIEMVGSDHVGLQFDFYHRQVMRGDLVHTIRDNLDITRHIQIANPPDRADPATGEINYDFIFAELEELGYGGWIGCEYVPKGPTADSLGWFEAYRTP